MSGNFLSGSRHAAVDKRSNVYPNNLMVYMVRGHIMIPRHHQGGGRRRGGAAKTDGIIVFEVPNLRVGDINTIRHDLPLETFLVWLNFPKPGHQHYLILIDVSIDDHWSLHQGCTRSSTR